MDVADARRLAEAMDAAGLTWQPASGDRFCIPDRDMDSDVFVISDMTINVEDAIGGAIVKFNGTTEWALDSIAAAQVLWLPWEHQLRDLLGVRFATLERLPGPAGGVRGHPRRLPPLSARGRRARLPARGAVGAHPLKRLP